MNMYDYSKRLYSLYQPINYFVSKVLTFNQFVSYMNEIFIEHPGIKDFKKVQFELQIRNVCLIDRKLLNK